MLLLTCPYCGPRDETEFSYGGEAGIVRPANSRMLADEEWADYLFMRRNPRGIWVELWSHTAGCRRWLAVERDTYTSRVYSSWPANLTPAGRR
jgi:sarcosine oxidase subunit delta